MVELIIRTSDARGVAFDWSKDNTMQVWKKKLSSLRDHVNWVDLG